MLPHLVPILLGARRFDPSQLFAAGEQGFWYDPSDLSSMYQDSTGITPVTAVEQAVGLILDKSKGLVLGPELVTNGGFATNSDWELEAGSTISGGALNVVAPGSGVVAAKQSVTFVPGRMYQIAFTLTGSGTGLSINIPGFSGIALTAAGTYTQFMIPKLTGKLIVAHRNGAGWTGTVDNISVRELAGNHAIQPTAASRAVLRSRYNLLTYSEQFDNAAWIKQNTTVTPNAITAPDGTTTADALVENSGANSRFGAFFTADLTPFITHTYSIAVKSFSGTRFARIILNTATPLAFACVDVNPQTGTIAQTLAPGLAGVSSSSTDLGNGWYRVSITAIGAVNYATVALITGSAVPAGDDFGYQSYTGDGTSGIYIWGADLRAANDTYLPYQRIAAATDYDTVGFPVYLAFDGSDDSLYTGGSIDFSATDKMTVWAGVTKLSDATQAPIVELGAGTGDGVFFLFAPRTNATADIGWRSRGTATAEANTAASYAAPLTSVLTAVGDISGDSALLRSDGVQVASSTADQGTGNFGNHPIYIGRRNNESLPFNGRLYQAIVRGAATNTPTIQQTERWVGGKMGKVL